MNVMCGATYITTALDITALNIKFGRTHLVEPT